MLVALIMLLEVLGIFYGNTLFWVVALSAYLIGIILVSNKNHWKTFLLNKSYSVCSR